MRLVATNKIPAGTEILVNYNYIADQWLDDQAARAVALLADWRFVYHCPACAPIPTDALERIMARQYQAALPDPSVAMTAAERSRHVSRINTYIHLLGSLRIWDDNLANA